MLQPRGINAASSQCRQAGARAARPRCILPSGVLLQQHSRPTGSRCKKHTCRSVDFNSSRQPGADQTPQQPQQPQQDGPASSNGKQQWQSGSYASASLQAGASEYDNTPPQQQQQQPLQQPVSNVPPLQLQPPAQQQQYPAESIQQPPLQQQQLQQQDPSVPAAASTDVPDSSSSSNLPIQQQQQWPPDVPWGLDTVVGVLSLWLLAYVAIGQLLVPSVLTALDLERAAMCPRELALLNLCVDCFQAALTLLLLAKCLGQYRPRTRGLFPLGWQRGRWLTWVAAGVGCFPVIDWVWKRGTSLLMGTEVSAHDMFHTQIELGLYTGDVITIGCYVIIVGVLAPLWEEVLFRGFLLPSLAKLVTPWPAVTLTALLFAWMHSSSEAIVPLLLVALGCGVLLVRFDNLLPPIILHGLYNLYVFANMAVQLHCGCGPVTASLSVSFGAAAVLLLAAAGVHWAGRHSSSSNGGGSSSAGGGSSSAGGSTPPPAVA